MAGVFISYSGDAGERGAQGIRVALLAQAGLVGLSATDMRVFIASDSLSVGSDLDEEIRQHLHICRYLVLVVTRESTQSHYVRYELMTALDLGKSIYPILGEGMTPKDLPAFIHRTVAIPIADIGKMTKMLVGIVRQQKAYVQARDRVLLGSQDRATVRKEVHPSRREGERKRAIADRAFSEDEIRRRGYQFED